MLVQQEPIIAGLFTDGLLELKYGVKLSQRTFSAWVDKFTSYGWTIGSERTGTEGRRDHNRVQRPTTKDDQFGATGKSNQP
jgi:hypothetical protein